MPFRAATVYLTGLCGALIWNRHAGILAAAATAFSSILILYTPFHLIATLQAFWIVLLLFMALKAIKSGNLFYWGLCGLIAGCGILTRGNIWFMVPGMALAAGVSVFRNANPEDSRPRNLLITYYCGGRIHYFGKEQLKEAIDEWKLVKKIDPDYKDLAPNLKKAELLYERLESIKQGKAE